MTHILKTKLRTATLVNSSVVSLKIKHTFTKQPSTSTPHIYPREMKTCSHKTRYVYVYNSNIPKSQTVGTTQMIKCGPP